MSEEGISDPELNPAIVCIVCNDSEVTQQHKFKPLMFALGCEPHVSDWLVAMDQFGEEFKPDEWLAGAQLANSNVVGRMPDAPIAVEGVPNA